MSAAGFDDSTARQAYERRLAQAQSVMREVNEQIHQLRDRYSQVDMRTIVCECSRSGCMTPIQIGPDEYESVRRFATRFILVAGHETEDVERVVETRDGYVVAEKIGVGVQVAIRLDPRRAAR